MNKNLCIKYFKKAYRNMKKNNKSLSVANIEYEMKKIFDNQAKEYIAFSKIAVNNMLLSGNIEVELEDLIRQLDMLPKLYSKETAIIVSNYL